MITEALLEMHFHRALIKYFESIYGAKFLRLLKPSSQKEVWLGFDQGWVRTDLTQKEFFSQLRQVIQQESTNVNNFYIGFFLQFKKVQKVTRRSNLMPSNYYVPYFRVELSLKPNKRTRLSQHETLLRLSQVNNASVYYACPMFFDLDALYEEPDLQCLPLVDVTTSPTGWATNDSHYITFQTESDSNPLWCSDPVQGVSYSVDEWVSLDSNKGPSKLTAENLITLITNAIETISGVEHHGQMSFLDHAPLEINVLPSCFTVIEFENALT